MEPRRNKVGGSGGSYLNMAFIELQVVGAVAGWQLGSTVAEDVYRHRIVDDLVFLQTTPGRTPKTNPQDAILHGVCRHDWTGVPDIYSRFKATHNAIALYPGAIWG